MSYRLLNQEFDFWMSIWILAGVMTNYPIFFCLVGAFTKSKDLYQPQDLVVWNFSSGSTLCQLIEQ
jgi:hypothetical protein